MRNLRFLAAFLVGVVAVKAEDIRVGIIGLDTSHTVAFAKLLNQDGPEHVAGARITAAFKGGSPDVDNSAKRIDGFTKEMESTYGVKIYGSIEEVARNVDALMVLSVDGRVHLDQIKRLLPFHHPIFVDKPLAASLGDVLEIFRIADEANVPLFTSSSRRFGPGIDAVKQADIGQKLGVFSHGPATLEPHHPDLFWYGIHAVEAMYSVMGPGCVSVTRTSTTDTDIVTGVWQDGRVGTVRGTRNAKHVYGLISFGSNANVEQRQENSYAPLVREIVKFYATKVSPIPEAETVEIFTFLEAADESKRRGGVPVKLADVLAHARNVPAARR